MPKLTSKDLEDLSELLDSEHLAYKKCCNYVSIACDPVLKAKLGTFANNHKMRYEALLGYLTSAQM